MQAFGASGAVMRTRVSHSPLCALFYKGAGHSGNRVAFIAFEKPPAMRSTVVMRFSPIPTTTPAYETYAISGAFSKRGPVDA